jgi:hypothetical protein
MNFEYGDPVVYTPNIEAIANAKYRLYDHGIVIGFFQDNYIVFQFNQRKSVHSILRCAVSHAPGSVKDIKTKFKPSLNIIKEAVAAREARRVMLHRTPMSVRLPGPAHDVQGFLTHVKRSKVNLKLLNKS